VEALGINLGYLLVQVFNFLILVVVLRAWVFKPIVGMLGRRRDTIAQGLEDARIAGEARANAEKEAQAVLTKAQQEATAQVRQAVERAEQTAREIKAKAEQEAAAIREAGAGEAEHARQQALADLRGQIGGLAIAAAQRLIQENLDEKRQRALIDEFFSGLKGGKVVLLAGEKVSGTAADVTTALPLTEPEKDTIRGQVSTLIGPAAEVTFRVDPAILGGLVIRVGDRVVDGSVAAQLEGMRAALR
jgi:F-type H+-transporting ATPase subunit b